MKLFVRKKTRFKRRDVEEEEWKRIEAYYRDDPSISINRCCREFNLCNKMVRNRFIASGVYRDPVKEVRGQYIRASKMKPKTGRFANDPYFNQEKKK